MVRTARLVVVVMALVCVPVARAWTPGQSCAGPPTVSALAQYCENVPSATGGRPPLPGSPALAGALPRSIVRAILRAGPQSTQRKLLRLPAGTRPVQPTGASTADPWGLSLPVIAALLVVGLGLAATAAARRRRPPHPT